MIGIAHINKLSSIENKSIIISEVLLTPTAIGSPVIVVTDAVLLGNLGCGGSDGVSTGDFEHRVLLSEHGGVHRVDGSASCIEQVAVVHREVEVAWNRERRSGREGRGQDQTKVATRFLQGCTATGSQKLHRQAA